MFNEMSELVSEWKRFNLKSRPYVLKGDKVLKDDKIAKEHLCRCDGWESFIGDQNFGEQTENKFHVDLLPTPFIGNLKTASVFLLMLNPGLGPHDYFGEYKISEYRDALLENLEQSADNRFLFLDPRFSWHGGYKYWHSKLHPLIKEFSSEKKISYGDARIFFQQEIAVIELVPYHSVGFSLPKKIVKNLASVRLAREFIERKIGSEDCLIVVARGKDRWKLPKSKNIREFTSQQARAAHLSVQSDFILDFLRKRHQQHPYY